MRLYITGGDERSKALKEEAEKRGHILTERLPDAVVLPLPKAGTADMKRYFPQGQKIVAGKVEDALWEMAQKEKWQMENVLEDETFLLENARLTAEGAVFKAMEGKKKALCYAKCMVIGYGRIGKYLTQMLKGMGSRVTVAARSEKARMEAGKESIAIHEIHSKIADMDFVFNTVPFPVLDEACLNNVCPNTWIMELASAPYGVDMAAAERLGVSVHIEGGLPGRYAPADAARVWLDYIERSGRQ